MDFRSATWLWNQFVSNILQSPSPPVPHQQRVLSFSGLFLLAWRDIRTLSFPRPPILHLNSSRACWRDASPQHDVTTSMLHAS